MTMQFMSYNIIGKKGEGTFSQVLKAQHVKSKKFVAIKCMKNVFKDIDQVNRLREIQALRRLSPHGNIIQLREVLYDKATGKLALVFELMDMNMYELIGSRDTYLPEEKIKKFMYQLVKSMEHMHRNGIFHRDIKPENLLIMDDYLKLADFGSCRGIYSKQPYTEYISTRWYRAPECLLTDGYYNHKMDIWGVGCVFFEVIALYPLFPGQDEIDQIHKIHNVLGTPSEKMLSKFRKHASAHMDFNFPKKKGTGIRSLLPNASSDCIDLLEKMLAYNPDERITSRQALRHPYFKELRESERKLTATRKKSAASNHGDSSRSSNGDVASIPSSPKRHHRHSKKSHQRGSRNSSQKHDTTSTNGSLRNTGGSSSFQGHNLPSLNHHRSKDHKHAGSLKKTKTSLHSNHSTTNSDASYKGVSSNHVSLPSVYSTNLSHKHPRKSYRKSKKRKLKPSKYGSYRSSKRSNY